MAEDDALWRQRMVAAQGGDRAAYAALLAAAIPKLRRTARARWPWATAATIEDAVQESLIALHSSLHLYDPERPFLPFLYGILRFRGGDVMRKNRRHQAREAAIDDLPETSGALRTERDADQGLEAEELRAAVAQLPKGQRMAIELTKLRELSLEEAAGISGQRIGALKVATHRGVLALRRRLKGTE